MYRWLIVLLEIITSYLDGLFLCASEIYLVIIIAIYQKNITSLKYCIGIKYVAIHQQVKCRYWVSNVFVCACISVCVFACICVCVFVCMCVFMCFFAVTATPFNLELSNFGIPFLMWISKNFFLKFLKNCFFAELSPFFYISLRFLCNFEEQLRKNQWR